MGWLAFEGEDVCWVHRAQCDAHQDLPVLGLGNLRLHDFHRLAGALQVELGDVHRLLLARHGGKGPPTRGNDREE